MNFKVFIVFTLLFSIAFSNPFLRKSNSSPADLSALETANVSKDSVLQDSTKSKMKIVKVDTIAVEKVEKTLVKKDGCNKISAPSFFDGILVKTAHIQKGLNKKISKLFKDIKKGDVVYPLFILLAISFLYGTLHALGPGHGKVVITSYMLTHKAKKITPIKIGSLVGIIHGFSAIVTVFGVYVIFKKGLLLKFDEIKSIIDMASAVIIIALGIFLLIRAILLVKNGHSKENLTDRKKSIFATALSIGIVPCPGAALILLFAINKELIFFGVLAVILMSIGMSITISAFGFLSTAINSSSKLIKNENIILKLEKVLSFVGAFLVIFIGFVLI